MKQLFDTTSYQCSKLITKQYSTSFSLGIKLLGKSIQPKIYAIYGFVRYADEIVDSFLQYNQQELFDEFVADYHKALDRKISMNPILNAFQEVVHHYQLQDLVESFLKSMQMDLHKSDYSNQKEYQDYIYGSADVVGLMCLKVFVNGNTTQYNDLKQQAKSLGSAFQKVNFLRDIKEDYKNLGRSYFPNIQNFELTLSTKQEIIQDIEQDFAQAYKGILKLPVDAKFGVYLAYRYYTKLLKKLKKKNAQEILESRTRIPNTIKFSILLRSYVRYKIGIL